MSVVVQDHVHLRGPHELRVDVNTCEAGPCVLAGLSHNLNAVPEPLQVDGIGASAKLLDGTLAPELVQTRHQEPAAATRRIEHPLSGLRAKHLDHRLDDIPRSEELTASLLHRRGDDGLVGHPLHVDFGIEEVVAG